MINDPDTFVRAVVADAPELTPILDEHLEDNYQELLPHVLLGDITRWLEAAAGTASAARVLGDLDDGLRNGSDDVRELVIVSFLENLDDGSPLLALLTPTLRETWQSLSR